MIVKKNYYVYILTNKKNGILYTGVTSNLIKRVLEHRLKIESGFAERYYLNHLVYYEQYDYIDVAIKREKQLKKWSRYWKIDLIEKENPNWNDLFYEFASSEQIELARRIIFENKELLRNNHFV